jgi:hypothetical protein
MNPLLVLHFGAKTVAVMPTEIKKRGALQYWFGDQDRNSHWGL